MTARFLYVSTALFMLRLWFCDATENAEIFKATEDPGGIYQQNQTASMSVTYKKPTPFRTSWLWQTTSVGHPQAKVVRSKLPESAKLVVSHSEGKITETIEIETNLTNSGEYIFMIVDPNSLQVVQMANFSLNILAAPSEIELITDHDDMLSNPRVHNSYIFDCSVKGYPHPNITWEINNCTNVELTKVIGCDDTWTPFEPPWEFFQLDATNKRIVVVLIKAKHIATIRCVAENTEGRLASKALLLVPHKVEKGKILRTAYESGFYRTNQTASMSVTYTKPTNFHTSWLWLTTKIRYPEAEVVRSKLPASAKRYFSRSSDGEITETINIETNLTNSGEYIFMILDPHTLKIVEMASFNLTILASPSDVKLIRKKDDNGMYRILLQLDDFDILQCSVMGYPHPNITWEISNCTNVEQTADSACNDTWTPLDFVGTAIQGDSTYRRAVALIIESQHTGTIRCVAENEFGRQASVALVLLPYNDGKAKILRTAFVDGIYRTNQTASMTVTYYKPELFRTEWQLWNIVTDTEQPSFIFELPKMSKRFVSNSTDGVVAETVEVETDLFNSGNYVFRIVDPSTNETVDMTNFELKIAAAPVDVTLKEIGFDSGTKQLYRGNEKGDNYMFECFAFGYPLPTLTWEFSECNSGERVMKERCEDNWEPIQPAEKIFTIASAFSTKERFGLRTETGGRIRCVAENTEGRQVSRQSMLFPTGDGEMRLIADTSHFIHGFQMTPNQTATAYRGDQLNVTCRFHKFMIPQFVEWKKMIFDGSNIKLADQYGLDKTIYELDKRHQLSYDNNSLGNRYTLTFNNISKGEAGIYTCVSFFRNEHVKRTINIAVLDDFAPVIAGRSTQVQFESLAPLSLPCVATGGPLPSVTWYKNGQIVDATQHDHFTVKPDSLDFVPVGESDEGEYICVANNRVGEDRKSFNLTQKISVAKSDKTAIILASVVGPIMLIGIIVMTRLAIINTLGRQNLHRLELELRSHQQTDFDPTLPIIKLVNSGTMKPGYSHCLNVDTLIMDRQNQIKLGEGNFGIVLLVKFRKSDGSVEPMALKRPKSNWDVDQYRMLYKEICLMTFLEKHTNIVNMIGYVDNISRGQLYMVMEYCTDGSLESRLDWVREDFVQRFCSELRNQSEQFADVDRYVIEDVPNWPSVKASLKPKGFVYHADLISYAYQVVSAMVYLAEIKFVHRDLAARNILLSHNFKVAKIADFGLSRRIYAANYKFKDKQPGLKLPLRWTPPESLMFGEFSSGSDVWSFGVVLGEIFSLGEIPFAHVPDVDFNPSQLLSGAITPSRPNWASNNIFNLILSCCKPERKSRITFAEAKMQLGAEFDRCSPEEHISLLSQLQEIERNWESHADSATGSCETSL